VITVCLPDGAWIASSGPLVDVRRDDMAVGKQLFAIDGNAGSEGFTTNHGIG
jgi:hypothetical protein